MIVPGFAHAHDAANGTHKGADNAGEEPAESEFSQGHAIDDFRSSFKGSRSIVNRGEGRGDNGTCSHADNGAVVLNFTVEDHNEGHGDNGGIDDVENRACQADNAFDAHQGQDEADEDGSDDDVFVAPLVSGDGVKEVSGSGG